MEARIPFPFALETERLLIQSPKATHAAELRAAIADSLTELRPWMHWAKAVPTPSAAQANCQHAEKAFQRGTDYRLHLFLKDSRTLIGCSGWHAIDWSVPKLEIGYWGRTPYNGNGYITEAVREITRFALEDLGMNRVEIRMSSKNAKSRAIPERLGFTLEGILHNYARHVDGSLRDTCIYACVPPAP